MWYDFAKKNNLERLLSLMDCPEANYGIRKKVKNELLFLKFLNFLMYPLDFYKYSLKVKIRYVEESILWLAQRDIPRDEKIKRIKMVLKR
jgi:hypothetical protein